MHCFRPCEAEFQVTARLLPGDSGILAQRRASHPPMLISQQLLTSTCGMHFITWVPAVGFEERVENDMNVEVKNGNGSSNSLNNFQPNDDLFKDFMWIFHRKKHDQRGPLTEAGVGDMLMVSISPYNPSPCPDIQ